MPGPCSAKRKKKQEAMKAKLKAVRVGGHQEVEKLDNVDVSLQNRAELTDVQKPPRHNYNGDTDASAVEKLDAVPPDASNLKPFIEDPGNGPRVKDTRAFLRSFFALPPSLDDPTCAYFARDGVLAALLELLPEEIAHILWYNRTRREGRICPACLRLYRIGDQLRSHVPGGDQEEERWRPPQVLREQQLSGICSSMCFMVASFNYPEVGKLVWGKTADELDYATCAALSGSGSGIDDAGLGTLVRMTRLHDLGLDQSPEGFGR